VIRRFDPVRERKGADFVLDMGLIDELGLKPGVITGDDVLHVLLPPTELLNDLAL